MDRRAWWATVLGVSESWIRQAPEKCQAPDFLFILLISHEMRESSYWAAAAPGSSARSSRKHRRLLHGRCSVSAEWPPCTDRKVTSWGSQVALLSPSPQPASHSTCILRCELETLVPTNSSQEIHIRRPCSASSRPLPTCSCSALRGVCGSTSHCHHSASASLTHKQGDTEHRCGELSGQVLGADLPDSHKGRSCEGCGGPSASLRDGRRAPGRMGLERRACAERRETLLCLHWSFSTAILDSESRF